MSGTMEKDVTDKSSNNIKLLGCVRAFDRHCNMVLENVREMWSEVPRSGKGKKKVLPVNKHRDVIRLYVTIQGATEVKYQ